MGIADFLKGSDYRKENEELKKVLDEIGAQDVLSVKKKIDSLKQDEQELYKKINSLKQDISNLENSIEDKKRQAKNEITKINFQIKEKEKEILSIDEKLLLESFALYTPHFAFENSSDYSDKLQSIRETQKNLIKSGMAASGNQNWTVNGSASEGKKMVNDMIKLVLRSFNNECDYCVDRVKFNNIEKMEKRINSSFDALNKLGRVMNVNISEQYKKLKFDELYLSYEYQQKKQEEKEELRRIREEEREQQKLEKEIKIAREKIAKEKKHYSQAIEEIKKKISLTHDESEILSYKQKLKELEINYSELESEEKLVDYREQNAKAGYVYVISNIGSFGENVYKIGMTRRLEPMDRIHELGDASVPFPFDVHALIFSDNAPELESKVHNYFFNNRLNKINNRKEFFKADIDEIEKILKSNFTKVLDVEKLPAAEQYRESLLMKE